MTPNAFIGSPKPPTESELTAALGPARELWDLLVDGIATELGVMGREWKSSGKKYGWSLRLKRGSRNIVHLSPCQGVFRVAVILGDRAVRAARAADLGERAVALIDEAPRYPEGTGIRLEVTSHDEIALVKRLAAIKLQH